MEIKNGRHLRKDTHFYNPCYFNKMVGEEMYYLSFTIHYY